MNLKASRNHMSTTSAAAHARSDGFASPSIAKVEASMLQNSTPTIDSTTIMTNIEKLFLTLILSSLRQNGTAKQGRRAPYYFNIGSAEERE